MNKVVIGVIYLALLLLTACNKGNNIDNIYAIPHSTVFWIKTNGSVITADSILDEIRLFYFKDNTKEYIPDFARCINEGGFNARDLGMMTTREVGLLSADNGLKDYFLEFPNGDIDTLYIDYKRINKKEAQENLCYCYYPLQEVRFNGLMAPSDTMTLGSLPVYLFEK